MLCFVCFSFQFLDIGIVTSIECNHKQVETARKGQEVCIKIEPIPGDSPKMFGRHFDETDMLTSKVSVETFSEKDFSFVICKICLVHFIYLF